MSASFFDLMCYARTGIAHPKMTEYDKLFALKSCSMWPIKTLTGETPLRFNSHGGSLIYLSMDGNHVQSGTPAPDAPIWPQECGDRTANLAYARIENANIEANGNIGVFNNYDVAIAHVENGATYTANSYVLAFYTNEPTLGSVSYNNTRVVATPLEPTTFTAPIDGYVAFRIAHGEPAMLNTGSTALPYEPYGYRITPTINNTQYPIYLSEPLRKIGSYADTVNSDGTVTRKINKMVFDGTTNVTACSEITGGARFRVLATLGIVSGDVSDRLCSHFVSGADWSVIGRFEINQTLDGLYFQVPASIGISTVQDAKDWLADQYAAGTPVTVWYVLATPTTESITAPTINTVNGINTLNVETILQPSSVTIKYR